MVLSNSEIQVRRHRGSSAEARHRKNVEHTMRRGYRAMARINRRLAKLLEEDADDAWDGA